ncbi:putative DBINO protein [Hordeum vulgare]|nr:putative DBINO protein [Hordeum vulgare]
MAKKKKAKAPRKPRAECMSEEIVKLDAESAKRRNRRATVKDNAAARKFAAERDAMEAARRKIEVEEKEGIVNKAHALLMLAICRSAGFFAAVVGPASTGSSGARSPRCQLPTSRTTAVSPGYPPPPSPPPPRHDAHTRFSGSLDESVITPSTPRPSACIDLNVAPGSNSGGHASVEMQRKQARPTFAGTMLPPTSCSTKCQHQWHRSTTTTTSSCRT